MAPTVFSCIKGISRIGVVLLIVVSLFSCMGEDADKKVEIAKSQTEKYYQLYQENKNNSILGMLSAEFYKETDSNMILKHIEDQRRNFGDVVDKKCVSVNRLSKSYRGKHELDIVLKYRVRYVSKYTVDETFQYIFDERNSNQIYSIEFHGAKKEQ